MKRKLLLGILGLFLVLCCAGGAWSDESKGPYTIMKPDRETRLRWIQDYEMAPRAYIDKTINFSIMPGGSLSLLSHLQYTPSERNQGSCGNCWAWAGTGVMGIALDVQENILDRLSVQFISSCNTAKSCCDGGWLSDLADFYTFEGYTIPWSNTNANWQNGDGNCNVPCSSIATLPSYDIDSIEAQTIETHSVGQAQAIANIKNVLNQNKAVWFVLFLPRVSDWDTFRNFWNTPGETVTTNLDYGCGQTWDSEGGGHAVLCVGYNDDNPSNSYWIMVNSWGTAGGGRPNGIFRLDMDMDYGCMHYDDRWFWNYYWQTLDVSFNGAVLYVESSGWCNGNTPCYSTIQGAVNAASSGFTIKIAGRSYGEDVSLNTNKNLIFEGGYDSTFTTQSSETTFRTMTISNGCAVVDKLTLVSTASWPNISYSGSDPYDYGAVQVGSSSDHDFTIQNTGSATLNISGASASGTGFSVVGSVPSSISAGGSDTITVRFAPGSVGSHTGTLSISSNDPDTPTLNIGLNGEGKSEPQQIASIVFINSLLCDSSSFTATLTIDGQVLTSVSGVYSDCEEFDCGVSLDWEVYANTGACGIIRIQSSTTFDCDCLYVFVLDLDGDQPAVFIYESCPGDCSDVSSVSIGSMKLLDSVVLPKDANFLGLTVCDPLISK